MTMANVTYYAHWRNADATLTHGILLLTDAGTAHFLNEDIGTWHTLTRDDVPYITRLGRCDIADRKLHEDGDRVMKCSKSLTRRAA